MSARLRLDGQPWGVRSDVWTAEQDEWLRARAGTVPIEELLDPYHQAFPDDQRTLTALIVRCKTLGVSRYMQGWSLHQLERFCGYTHRTILAWWITPGLLRCRRCSGRGPGRGWWFTLADLEQFVRDCGWAYDWRRMDPARVAQPLRAEARHLRSLAELADRTDPWRTIDDLCQTLHIGRDYWRYRGLIPCRYRPKNGQGQGYVMVRGRDFAAIKDAIAEASHRHRSESARRHNWRRRMLVRQEQRHEQD